MILVLFELGYPFKGISLACCLLFFTPILYSKLGRGGYDGCCYFPQGLERPNAAEVAMLVSSVDV